MIGDSRTDTTRGKWALFIGPPGDECQGMMAVLRSLGFTLAVADDFHEAKQVLAEHSPDLLITHVRLGAYNGLQLVLRGKMTRPAMAAIVVVDAPDPVLQRDADEMAASLILSTAAPEAWTEAALGAIARQGHVPA